ncbi:hypothetical protein FACS1894180_2810 [Bacteroidia bacterium]|nr:hypothetical protein FACS1894180_2810 [Bacteroidia bacterium]
MKKVTNKILIAFLSIILIINVVIVAISVNKINNYVEEQISITNDEIEITE